MTHNVETMMYVGTRPWHGLGTYCGDRDVTAAEALEAAGLDWEVELADIYLQNDEKVEGYHATIRRDKKIPLGVVGSRYRPIQNQEAFNFFDSVVGEGRAIYHTAGSLGRGERVWILARLPGDLKIRDDVVERFILLYNSHDGSEALTMMNTPVRVVCQNTLNFALGGFGERIRIRHTKSYEQKLEEARGVLGLAEEYYRHLERLGGVWLSTEMDVGEMRKFSEELFPLDVDMPARAHRERAVNAIMDLFRTGAGSNMAFGTVWGAVNAVVEFADHFTRLRGNGADRRLKSIWFGGARGLKQHAFRLLLDKYPVTMN